MDNYYNISVPHLLAENNNNYDLAIEQLRSQIHSGEITFPFHRYSEKPPQELFSNLQQIDLELIHKPYKLYSYYPKYGTYLPPKFRNKPTIISGNKETYENVDVISDYFIEDIRLKAKRYDQIKSILDCWVDDNCITEILKVALNKDFINPKTLRSAIYETLAETKIFNPTWAKSLLKLSLGPDLSKKKWLDISAGWGDRLITAMALDMDYIGYDPNTELQKGHSEMISMFGDPKRHKVIYEPFETATLPNETFDVVLTSTPYFNLEEYNHGQVGQSIVSYPEFEQWMVWFLFESLRKAWEKLKVGGYLILHLGDAKTIKTAEATNIFIENNLPNSSWEGIIGLRSESGYPRPVWVWKKVATNQERIIWEPDHRSKHGIPYHSRTLMNTYPELQDELLRFYTHKYAPNYQIRRNNAKIVREHVKLLLPNTDSEIINTILEDDLMISSFLEVYPTEDTINWMTQQVINGFIDETFLNSYIPNYKIRNDNGTAIVEHVVYALPNIDKEQISDLLRDKLMLSSLLETLGDKGLITWATAMTQLSLR